MANSNQIGVDFNLFPNPVFDCPDRNEGNSQSMSNREEETKNDTSDANQFFAQNDHDQTEMSPFFGNENWNNNEFVS